jgi:hypothetical protein
MNIPEIPEEVVPYVAETAMADDEASHEDDAVQPLDDEISGVEGVNYRRVRPQEWK